MKKIFCRYLTRRSKKVKENKAMNFLSQKLIKIMCFVMIAGVLPAFAGV